MNSAEQNASTGFAGDLNISDAISKLMAHPELISMVASALGQGQTATSVPPSETDSQQASATADVEPAKSPAPPEISPEMMSSIAPIISKLSSARAAHGTDSAKYEQLLCALKPYVSSGRAEAIDYMIKISHLSSLIGTIK